MKEVYQQLRELFLQLWYVGLGLRFEPTFINSLPFLFLSLLLIYFLTPCPKVLVLIPTLEQLISSREKALTSEKWMSLLPFPRADLFLPSSDCRKWIHHLKGYQGLRNKDLTLHLWVTVFSFKNANWVFVLLFEWFFTYLDIFSLAL